MSQAPRVPVVGDRVIFHPAGSLAVPQPDPVNGYITHVWSPSCVNLQLENGDQPTSVLLCQGDDSRPGGYWCEFGQVQQAPAPAPQPSLFSTGPAGPNDAAVVSSLTTSETAYPAPVKAEAVEPSGLFSFKLKQIVKLTPSDETGTVEGRAEFTTSEPSYLIRYCDAQGRAREAWWAESALHAL